MEHGVIPVECVYASASTQQADMGALHLHATTETTGAHCVATQPTTHKGAPYWGQPPNPLLFKILTPFIAVEWEQMLIKYNLLHRFADIPRGIREGFNMGITSIIRHTYTPPNHQSALENTKVINMYIKKERSKDQYSGPFSLGELEHLIGPFQTLLLGTIPKAGTNELRMIQDFSFLYSNLSHTVTQKT
jgi:hypothetical protein